MPLPTPLRDLGLRARSGRYSREVSLALAAVLLIGLGAATQPTPDRPVAATLSATQTPATHPAQPSTARTQPVAKTKAKPKPKSAQAHKGTKHRAKSRRAAKPVKRWLPTGTGMWIHDWSKTEGGHAGLVVRRAQAAGLTHLFVQTGSSKKGWIGQPVLSQLLPATRNTDIKVVAWDFPKLVNPEDDARRLAKAAWWRRPGVPMIAAVAPDIETASEGTHATPSSINRYYRTLRKALPQRVAILATVPWPSEKRVTRYPYVRTALYADAFVPMAYWYNRSPSRVTATSMRILRRYGKPVFPVGQGYDGRLDAPYLAADRTPGKSVDAFVQAARSSGATSISLWSWQTAGMQQWMALHRASNKYTPKSAPKRPVKANAKGKATKPGWHPGKKAR